MADTITVARNFDQGFQSDTPRDQLGSGVAYRMKDWIPRLGSPLRKRGGWQYANSNNLSILSAITRIDAVAWAPFPADGHLIGGSDNGKLFAVRNSVGALIGTNFIANPTHAPFWHRDRMIMPASLTSAAANPKKYYTTGGGVFVLADVGGTPPQACIGASFGDYLILGNGVIGSTRYANRIWFSAVGNPDSWPTTTSFWDFPEEVTAIVPKSNLIMVFGYSGVHELTGTSPPPGGDFALRRYVFNQGTFDSRSVVTYRDNVIWANNAGVWKSDGTTLSDITEQGGISQLWQSLCSTFNYTNGWKAAAGVFRNEYHITIFDNNGAVVISLVCDLENTVWREETNIRATQYASRPSSPGTANDAGSEEMFTAFRGGPRIGKLSPIFTPSIGNINDADGTPVTPVIETPFYKMGSTADKRIRNLYLNYVLTGGGTLQVDYVGTPDASAYANLGSLAARAAQDRKPQLRIAKKLSGIGLRITQVGASSDTRLSEVELEGHPLGGTR